MAFTKLRAKREWAGIVPAGTEIVVETNSPNCYPGELKIMQKLIQLGYPEKKVKQYSLAGVFEIVK